MITKFRASLVPAAAVIPAELEMGNIVAVKTYVAILLLAIGLQRLFALLILWLFVKVIRE